MALALRPYQTEAVEAIEDGLARGVRRPLMALPTGTGKTVIFADLIAKRGGRALVLAHRDELLKQAVDKIKMSAPDLDVGIVRAEHNNVDAQVVVGSVPTLWREKRLSQLPQHFTTVIVDEAHHSAADSYVKVLDHVEGSDLVLGVTATPERTDNRALGDLWDEVVYKRTLLDMILAGYLCDLRAVRVEVDVDLDGVKQGMGQYGERDFQAGDLGRAMSGADAAETVVDAYLEHAADRKAILFAPTVDVAQQMRDEFLDNDVAAETVHAETEWDVRKGAIERLRSGETRVITNVGIFTEGFDEPSIDCIIMASPTKSRIKYVQCVGRGTRLYPGKQDCLVLDVCGVTERLDLQSLPKLFGLDVLDEDVTVTEAIAAAEASEAEAAGEAATKAREVDLFKRLSWIDVDGEWFTVSAGKHGRLELRESPDVLGEWVVLRSERDKRFQWWCSEVLGTVPTLGYAYGIAEDWVREHDLMGLVGSDKSWREAPATPVQLETLRKWRVNPKGRITKGQASDLLGLEFARASGPAEIPATDFDPVSGRMG